MTRTVTYSGRETATRTVHRRRNQGGKGGWSPPKVLVYYYTILCYNVLLHGWCPPIETDLPTLLQWPTGFIAVQVTECDLERPLDGVEVASTLRVHLREVPVPSVIVGAAVLTDHPFAGGAQERASREDQGKKYWSIHSLSFAAKVVVSLS